MFYLFHDRFKCVLPLRHQDDAAQPRPPEITARPIQDAPYLLR